MSDRIPESPPVVYPIPDNTNRPLWSVMIPAYNCINYLRATIESVLCQDQGEGLMQIEVVDDCSTDGDVAQLVLETGKGRVAYFRQDENVGSLRNFETCLNRSRGIYIHLLHGDDLVLPGFYAEIKKLFDAFPEIGAAFTRYAYVNSEGKKTHNGRLIQDFEGVVDNWLYKVASSHGLQPPAIVVKRSVYEQLGGFFAVHYGEDWEMWVRIAKHYPVAYSPKILAWYRVHPANISSSFFRTGQSLEDVKKVIGLIAEMIPEQQRSQVVRAAKNHFSSYLAEKSVADFGRDKKKYMEFAYKVFRFDSNPRTFKAFGFLYLRYVYSLVKGSARRLLKRQ
jgi:glycosyltransferase involved in cell wall biosynthesis